MALLAVVMVMNVAAQVNSIYIEDFEIMPDSSVTVPVILANEEPTRGIQFNLTLPKNLTLLSYALPRVIADQYNMHIFGTAKEWGWTLGMYPSTKVCFSPDTLQVMLLQFKAEPGFKGGEINVWKCRGSSMDNVTIFIGDDTTRVTVPKPSIINLPTDEGEGSDMFFSL